MHKITVLGDGAFGTALAQTLATQGHEITLWCYNPQIASSIEQTRCNQFYLPALSLSERIKPSLSIEEALSSNPSWIVEAIPVAYMRSVLSQAKHYVSSEVPWVIASKGIEEKTHLLPSLVLSDSLGFEVPTVVLSGPSFALELAQGQPTGVTLASKDRSLANALSEVMPAIYTDITTDIVGTQLCGAVKNVIALTLGILDGAGYGANTQALVFTKMIQELKNLIIKQDGSQETLLLLAGIGDLTLTAYSSQSRNKTLGKAIGKKEYLNKELPYTEGINTLRSLASISREPLMSSVSEVVFNSKPVESIIAVCKAK